MSTFAPPFWLRNAHIQSILPSFPFRRTRVERYAQSLTAASVEHILDCGDGVRLQGFHASQERQGRPPASQLVVLHHGWEGSTQSLYILGLGQILFDRGYDVFRLNLRDHGDTHHLNRGLFHSCRIEEAVGAVRAVQRLLPDRQINLVGFSLGGNFALRIGARAGQAALKIRSIVAISPVLDPEATLHALENGFALYHRYFVWKWSRSLRKKERAWPGVYDFDELLRVPRLGPMTDSLVRRYSDFPDMTSYLRGYSIVHGALERLEVPSRIIAASDDPMIPVRDLGKLPRLPNLTVMTTGHGGHCGFADRLKGENWLANRVLDELRQ